MSRIDYLISQLCPDGVPSFSLKEVFELRNGYTPSKSIPRFWADGTVPWFRMEDIQKNGRILDSAIQSVHVSALKGSGMYEADSILMSTSATIGEHAMVTVPFLANQRFTVLTRKSEFKSRLLPKFAYYLMFDLAQFCKENTTMSSFAGVEMSKFRDYRIQLAPIEVQREIIEILDTFTGLEAELEAELQARKTQSSHYKNSLLSSDSVPKVQLGELVEVLDNLRKPVSRDKRQVGEFPYYGANGIQGYVKDFIFDGTFLLMGEDGSVINVDKSPILHWVEGKIWVNNHAHILQEKSDRASLRYVYYALQMKDVSSLVRGMPPKINQGSMRGIEIALPSLEEQLSIVKILDTFTELEIQISEELTLRRKQYEHYRRKLLTFEAAEVA